MNIIVKSAGMLAGASILATAAFGETAPDVTLDGFAVGSVKLMCRERNGWKVDFRREKDASGVEYAVVEMTRGEPDYPGRIQPLLQRSEAGHRGSVAPMVRMLRFRHVLGPRQPPWRRRDRLPPLDAALCVLQLGRTQPHDLRRVRVVRAARDKGRHPRGR